MRGNYIKRIHGVAMKDFSKGYKFVTEGSVTIPYPESNEVFYNKVCAGFYIHPRFK